MLEIILFFIAGCLVAPLVSISTKFVPARMHHEFDAQVAEHTNAAPSTFSFDWKTGWMRKPILAITPIAFALIALTTKTGIVQAALYCSFATTLISLAFIDLDTKYLPDSLTLPLLWCGLLVSVSGNGQVSPGNAILASAIGYLSLWGIFHTFRLITGQEGMGYGDFKLLAAIGAWMGAGVILPVVIVSSVLGSISTLPGVSTKMKGTIPYGPFLVLGAFLTLLTGFRLSF